MCVASVILLAAASVPASAAAPTARLCRDSCGQDTVVTRPDATSPAEPCIRNAGCGGGASLTISVNTLLVVCTVATGIVAGTPAVVGRRIRPASEPRGSLVATRLFRPPRLLLAR